MTCKTSKWGQFNKAFHSPVKAFLFLSRKLNQINFYCLNNKSSWEQKIGVIKQGLYYEGGIVDVYKTDFYPEAIDVKK